MLTTMMIMLRMVMRMVIAIETTCARCRLHSTMMMMSFSMILMILRMIFMFIMIRMFFDEDDEDF